MTFALLADRAGLLDLVLWLIDGMFVEDVLMVSNRFAI
jgi:hypothetical protein